MDPIIQKIQEQIDSLQEQIKALKNDDFIEHQHNGFDSIKVEYNDINRKIIYVSHTIVGADAATAANFGVFFIVPVACVLTGFQEVHQTAGNDAGAVTLTLEKLTGTTAPDSGVVMLASTLSLKATANTVQDGVPTLTLGNRTLKAGDRLCLKDAGTLTTLANVTVKVELTVL